MPTELAPRARTPTSAAGPRRVPGRAPKGPQARATRPPAARPDTRSGARRGAGGPSRPGRARGTRPRPSGRRRRRTTGATRSCPCRAGGSRSPGRRRETARRTAPDPGAAGACGRGAGRGPRSQAGPGWSHYARAGRLPRAASLVPGAEPLTRLSAPRPWLLPRARPGATSPVEVLPARPARGFVPAGASAVTQRSSAATVVLRCGGDRCARGAGSLENVLRNHPGSPTPLLLPPRHRRHGGLEKDANPKNLRAGYRRTVRISTPLRSYALRTDGLAPLPPWRRTSYAARIATSSPQALRPAHSHALPTGAPRSVSDPPHTRPPRPPALTRTRHPPWPLLARTPHARAARALARTQDALARSFSSLKSYCRPMDPGFPGANEIETNSLSSLSNLLNLGKFATTSPYSHFTQLLTFLVGAGPSTVINLLKWVTSKNKDENCHRYFCDVIVDRPCVRGQRKCRTGRKISKK